MSGLYFQEKSNAESDNTVVKLKLNKVLRNQKHLIKAYIKKGGKKHVSKSNKDLVEELKKVINEKFDSSLLDDKKNFKRLAKTEQDEDS